VITASHSEVWVVYEKNSKEKKPEIVMQDYLFGRFDYSWSLCRFMAYYLFGFQKLTFHPTTEASSTSCFYRQDRQKCT
jgi:hypothetical protein